VVQRKLPLFIILLGVGLLLALLMLLPPKQVASAQCKNLSQCKNCHELQGLKPVNQTGQWHTDHQLFDFCYACHAGNRDSLDAAQAHTDLTLKLNEMPGSCKTCHSADLDQKYKIYADLLGVDAKIDPKALAKAANPQKNLGTFLGGKTALNVTAAVSSTGGAAQPAKSSKPTNPTANWIAGVLFLALLAGGSTYVYRNERRLNNPLPPRGLKAVWALVRQANWSPYAAGVLLGVTGIFSVLLAHRLLGASTGMATIASSLMNAAAPDTAQNNMYFKFIMPPGLNWEVLLLVGMFFGGMFAALTGRTFKLRWNSDPAWRKVFGAQGWKRFVLGFLGAVVIQYGAGIAGGCTSGLAISGGMLLAPSAFVFMAGMFLSGILAALVVYGRRY
jgi:hypothetical protein